MLGLVVRSLVAILAFPAAADIAGALAVTVVDILPLRFASAALAYAIWLVIGVFAGLVAYNAAGAWAAPKPRSGDWSAQPGARGVGSAVLAVGVLVMVGLAALFYALFWSHALAADDYVPDSLPHSVVFLLAVVAGMGLGRFALMSDPGRPESAGIEAP